MVLFLFIKSVREGVGDDPCSATLAVLTENLAWFPGTCVAAHKHLKCHFPGIQHPTRLCEDCTHMKNRHTCQQNIQE